MFSPQSCKAELDADIGTDHRGDLKSVLSRFCRKMQTILPHYEATILCTNQLRRLTFQRPERLNSGTARKTDLRNEATVGGNALRYRSALRLRLEPLVNGTLVQVERGGTATRHGSAWRQELRKRSSWTSPPGKAVW